MTCCTVTQNESGTHDYPIHHLLQEPLCEIVFDGREIEQAKLLSVLKAVQWVCSASEAQPWSFIVATREHLTTFAYLYDSLSEREQRMVGLAPVLILCMAQLGEGHRGQPYHDLGLAVESMIIQARSLGLAVRQMVTFDRQYIRRHLGIPKLHVPVVVLALGYGRNTTYSRQSKAPDGKPMGAYVFSEQWGRPLRFDVAEK